MVPACTPTVHCPQPHHTEAETSPDSPGENSLSLPPEWSVEDDPILFPPLAIMPAPLAAAGVPVAGDGQLRGSLAEQRLPLQVPVPAPRQGVVLHGRHVPQHPKVSKLV